MGLDQNPSSKNHRSTSKETVPITTSPRASAQPMETDLVGPPLTPHFNQRFEAEASGYSSDQSAQVVKPKKRADKRKHKSRAQYITSSSSSSEDSDQSMQV